MVEDFAIKEILLLILGSLSTYLIWRVQYQKEKIKNIENIISDKKYKLYSELVYIIIDVMHGEKVNKKPTDNELLERILFIKRDMFLYGSDEMFRKFIEWFLETNKNPNNTNHIKIYYELMKMARKDMGQLNTDITLDEFMLFLIQNEDEYAKFKLQNNW
ncbi:hypothetical protein ACI513_08005 [Chryseobacterium sp. M5]|uniref:hypothetical protein n=1 Tax=Chryseobacterium TaxID=59732 RepID=UPI000C9E8209|nr:MULTISPECIES: hypothetical protein [Chryseobacterium]VXB92708.1 conserved hypothetical protein [Chryseobacterium sp. 8AT]